MAACRRLMRLAVKVPDAGRRQRRVANVKAVFRNAKLSKEELNKQAQRQLGILRIDVPRRLWPDAELRAEQGGTYVYEGGALQRVSGPSSSSARTTVRNAGVTSDDLRRHHALLERMRFRGPHWQKR